MPSMRRLADSSTCSLSPSNHLPPGATHSPLIMFSVNQSYHYSHLTPHSSLCDHWRKSANTHHFHVFWITSLFLPLDCPRTLGDLRAFCLRDPGVYSTASPSAGLSLGIRSYLLPPLVDWRLGSSSIHRLMLQTLGSFPDWTCSESLLFRSACWCSHSWTFSQNLLKLLFNKNLVLATEYVFSVQTLTLSCKWFCPFCELTLL